MERLSDILNNFKERISNPFIFSFLSAWVICNWEIFISLFWLNSDEIKREGYRSLFDVIRCNSNTLDNVWIPLMAAFLYVTLVRNAIIFLHTFATNWGEKLNLKIAERGVVSVSNYIAIKERMEGLEKNLEKVLQDDAAIRLQYNKYRIELDEKKVQLNQIETQFSHLSNSISNFYQIKAIAGRWIVITDTQQLEVDIEGYNYFVLDQLKQRTTGKRIISNFFLDQINNKAFFVTVPDEDKKTGSPIVYQLLWAEYEMTGTENGSNVRFVRPQSMLMINRPAD